MGDSETAFNLDLETDCSGPGSHLLLTKVPCTHKILQDHLVILVHVLPPLAVDTVGIDGHMQILDM